MVDSTAGSRLASVRSENAGVTPSTLTMATASSGPRTNAATATVAPSMANTAMIWPEVAPLLRSRAISVLRSSTARLDRMAT